MNHKSIRLLSVCLVAFGFLFLVGIGCAPPPSSTPTLYSLTYNGNENTGGSVPTDPDSPYEADTLVTVLGNTGSLTRTGYTFSGWNTETDGNGDFYEVGDSFEMPEDDAVLFADWEAIPGFAYLSGGFTYLCEISFSRHGDENFSPCTDSGFMEALSYSMAFNSASTTAYIVSFTSQKVFVCPVNSNHTFGTCVDSGATFVGPFGIALNPSNTFAYVTDDAAGNVKICPIKTDGTFNTCTTSSSTFSAPQGIAVNSAGTMAYVVDRLTNAVFRCPINSGGDSFEACVDSGNTGLAFIRPEMITLNSAGTFAYIPNYGTDGNPPASFVSVCPINSSGTFGACVNSGGTAALAFDQPKQVAFNLQGTTAYVTNASQPSSEFEGAVYSCPVKTDGSFDTCSLVNTGVDLSNLLGISIIP